MHNPKLPNIQMVLLPTVYLLTVRYMISYSQANVLGKHVNERQQKSYLKITQVIKKKPKTKKVHEKSTEGLTKWNS